jgi:hypothetical protein
LKVDVFCELIDYLVQVARLAPRLDSSAVVSTLADDLATG